jgi:hypothetical protein
MRGKIRPVMPSASLIVSIVALVVATTGAGVALSTLDGGQKRQVKRIAGKVANRSIDVRAPGLDVAHAKAADNASTARAADTASTANAADTAATAQLLDGLPPSAFARVDAKAPDSDLLDGIDSAELVQGAGETVVGRGAIGLGGVFHPSETFATLATIPGLGSFKVGGANGRPGNDCALVFTNTSGGEVAFNGAAGPGLGDGGTVELAGIDDRPNGADARFTIMTVDAGMVAAGQATVTWGFPNASQACAGGIVGLLDG